MADVVREYDLDYFDKMTREKEIIFEVARWMRDNLRWSANPHKYEKPILEY